MSPERTTLEMIAPTIEEAVAKGLEQLNLAEDAVEVEVLDAGSRGLFGLGSRLARVRLVVKDANSAPAVAEKSAPTEAPAVEKAPRPARKPRAAAKPEPETQAVAGEAEEEELMEGDILYAARQVVEDLLEKMRIKATVTATMRKAEDAEDEDTIMVNIEGDDLSILIGKRSETLNALQYVASLIVGKRLNRWAPLMIDVQGYRARRERQLRVLARRMAEQAVHTGRRQVLEPMPANERRVGHLELRGHPQGFTASIGEDPNRKVTISLKQ